jgi:hypothetical protein
MNDEVGMIWKEALMAYFEVLYKPCLNKMRKITKTLNEDSQTPG